MAGVSQHRVHVGGLAATVTEKDLMNRFSSFGTVVEGSVAGLGLDANGAPKKFAFLTLETTDAGMKKCTSLLSGSVWKGVKLRLSPAKLDYQARLAKEVATGLPPSTQPTKKRKQSSDPSIGRPAPFFELVDSTNFARHRGWALDTSAITSSPSTSAPVTPAPIFPLITRPSHPLPPIPRPASTSWTREAPKAKASKEARAAAKAGLSVMPNTINRAQRVRIDVRRWGRKKIVYGEEAERGEGFGRLRGVWEVEDEEMEDEEDEEVAAAGRSEKDKEMIKWVFRTRDGQVKRLEVVKLGRRTIAHTDRFTALLEGLDRPDPAPIPAPSSLAPASIPDSFEIDYPILSSTVTPTSERPPKRHKSLSPPPYVPAAPRTLLFNEEDTFALITSTQEADEVEQARREERRKQLDVLKLFLGDGGGSSGAEQGKQDIAESGQGPQVEGFGNEESDDDEEFMGILKQGRVGVAMSLRGGAAPMEGDSEEDDSESESDAAEKEVLVPMPSKSKKEKGVSKDQLNSLKDMFKPQESTSSFSLLSGMALDINPLDLERSPSPPLESFPIATLPKMIPLPQQPQQQPPHSQARHQQNFGFVPPPALGRSKRAWVGTGGVTAFYPVVDEDVREDLDEKTIQARKREWLGNQKTAEAFHRTQSLEEIETEHQKLRDALRGLARKRHREASKKGRGKGVKRVF